MCDSSGLGRRRPGVVPKLGVDMVEVDVGVGVPALVAVAVVVAPGTVVLVLHSVCSRVAGACEGRPGHLLGNPCLLARGVLVSYGHEVTHYKDGGLPELASE